MKNLEHRPGQRGALRAAIAALFLVAAGSALANWPTYFGGPVSQSQAFGTKTDAEGDVYVVGTIVNSAFNSDVGLLKYDRSGNLLWSRLYNGDANLSDSGVGLDLDANGNIYATGQTKTATAGNDIVTLCYSPSGTPLWVKQQDGSGQDDAAVAIAADPTGGCVVTGTVTSSGVLNMITTRYNLAGDKVFSRQYALAGLSVRPSGIAVNSAGDAYIVASTTGGTFSIVTLKYTLDGTREWVKTFSAGHGGDAASAIALDHDGNVYVAGYSYSGVTYDFLTLKYTPSGVKAWQSRYLTNKTSELASAIRVEGDGALVVAGTALDGSNEEALTVKMDQATGNTIWAKKIRSPNALPNVYARSVEIDDAGNIYVAAILAGFGSNSYSDYMTVKYSADGTRLWTKYVGDGTRQFLAMGTAIDAAHGRVFVTGYAANGSTGTYTIVTTRY